MFLNLYTDKSKGIISEQRFLKLTDAMEQEQNSNKARLSELNLLLHQSDEQEAMFMPLSRNPQVCRHQGAGRSCTEPSYQENHDWRGSEGRWAENSGSQNHLQFCWRNFRLI